MNKMSLYEPPFCHHCGIQGHRQNTCPELPCAYCRQKGHSKLDCPESRACYWCGWKGHAPSYCWKNPNLDRGAAGSLGSHSVVKPEEAARAGAGAAGHTDKKKQESSRGEDDNNRRVKTRPKERIQTEKWDEEDDFEILIDIPEAEGSNVPEENVEKKGEVEG